MTWGIQFDATWLPGVLGALTAVLLGILLTYAWTPTTPGRRLGLGLLKGTALGLLLFCLLNPLRQEREPKSGENLLLIAVDESLSMESQSASGQKSFQDQVRQRFQRQTGWIEDLEQRFQVRYYGLGEQLRATERDTLLQRTQNQSQLYGQVGQLLDRYRDRPLAGVVVVTDGLATDAVPETLPTDQAPLYPVLMQRPESPQDLALVEVRAQPTQFETTPLRMTAELKHLGFAGQTVRLAVFDDEDQWLTEQMVQLTEAATAVVNLEVDRFEGQLARYRVLARLASEWPSEATSPSDESQELTLLNNAQRILVPRQGGPYRILYVSGRPNWEFKFLRRSLQQDPELQLLGLLRLALREPRFEFLDREDRRNPLFQGTTSDEEQVEQYDQPVLIRIGTQRDDELQDGFPKSADVLFRYSAVILDDIDAQFFSQDQLDLLQDFVERRGGGLLMLGGPDGFDAGKFDQTLLSSLLPIYTQSLAARQGGPMRWELNREGWLTPWTRLRETEQAERQVRRQMPEFWSVNRVQQVKPGASVLSVLVDDLAEPVPALVTQSYGRGRSAVLTLGDLFRWRLHTPTAGPPTSTETRTARQTPPPDDFGQSWRQLLRWLVAELPQRVELDVRDPGGQRPARELTISVRNEAFFPDDSADVRVQLRYPDGTEVEVQAERTLVEGQYRTRVELDQEGYYQVECRGTDREGEPIGTAVTGWAWEPVGDELRQLVPETQRWEAWAEASQGRAIDFSELPRLGSTLNVDRIPLTELKEVPLWHRWPVFLAALTLLGLEWGWRRWLGLA